MASSTCQSIPSRFQLIDGLDKGIGGSINPTMGLSLSQVIYGLPSLLLRFTDATSVYLY